jgi:hypothetical protein
MKCCGSPITSIAVNSPGAERVVNATLQAIMFGEIMKPLAKSLGPVGDVLVASVAQQLFVPPRA